MNPMRIIFMGTPEFAVPSLEVLLRKGWNIVAVVTAPDKPQGRGLKFSPSPVKRCALQHSIPVLQPEKLKDPAFIEQLKSYKADLQVVVAFRMLPEIVWNMPPRGTFNLHASLLPQYRGAAPIPWAIINGEKETGVTTFLLQHEIDTGKIIFQEKETILDEDDGGTLYTRLMEKGSLLVEKTVAAISSGNFPQTEQIANGPLKAAPKIFKETCVIDWDQSSYQLRNFIRGLSPAPGATTLIHERQFKIFRVSLLNEPRPSQAWITDNKTYLRFRTADGCVAVEELQPEGKKRMDIKTFFLGNKL